MIDKEKRDYFVYYIIDAYKDIVWGFIYNLLWVKVKEALKNRFFKGDL